MMVDGVDVSKMGRRTLEPLRSIIELMVNFLLLLSRRVNPQVHHAIPQRFPRRSSGGGAWWTLVDRPRAMRV